MINRVILVGNLGKDPERKSDNLVKGSLATNKKFKDKSGEWQERTTWHNLVWFGAKTDYPLTLQKGQTLYVEGEINNYEKDGKYYSDIVVQYVKPLSKKEAEAASNQGGYNYP